MSDERKFLAQIEAQPEDRVVRLVYADWLEERGDARGELIRVVEEMRTLPIHADRYWELKPRRRALLESAKGKKAWLNRLGYASSSDYEPVFADVPDDWKGRWRLLREFTERWYGVPMDDVGAPLKESKDRHPMVDDNSAATLPPSLREWIAFMRDLEQIEKKQAVHFGPGRSENHELHDGGNITFLVWEGYRETLEVSKSNPQQPDPPVAYWDHTSRERVPSSSHLTTFALQYLLSAWQDNSLDYKAAFRVTRTKALARKLAAAFPVRSEWDGIQIFERKNMLFVLNQDPVFTNNQLDLRGLVRKPASWGDVPEFISDYRVSRDSAGFTRFEAG